MGEVQSRFRFDLDWVQTRFSPGLDKVQNEFRPDSDLIQTRFRKGQTRLIFQKFGSVHYPQ